MRHPPGGLRRLFYARRAWRLLPAAVLLLVVTLVAAVVLLPTLSARAVAHDAVGTALWTTSTSVPRNAKDRVGSW
ncbi:MAG TPA: hypothetical protein VIJ07_15645 [Dermatophilaceae bacterium]